MFCTCCIKANSHRAEKSSAIYSFIFDLFSFLLSLGVNRTQSEKCTCKKYRELNQAFLLCVQYLQKKLALSITVGNSISWRVYFERNEVETTANFPVNNLLSVCKRNSENAIQGGRRDKNAIF